MSQRAEQVSPFYVMQLLGEVEALRASGRDVISLQVGEPDFPTPNAVVEAAQQSLLDGKTLYTAAEGLPALRAAISSWYASRYRCVVDPDRIIITPGASQALQLALFLAADAGDLVAMPSPTYPCNRNFCQLFGLQQVQQPLQYFADFGREWLDQLGAVRALILASPDNPSGQVLSAAQLQQLADWQRQSGSQVIMDEIYQGLEYHNALSSFLQYTDQAIIVNSFSKYFNMTGWRLGWLVVPEAEVETARRLAQNLYLAAPTMAQYAALACFSPQVQAIYQTRVSEFDERRQYLIQALESLGFAVIGQPKGAFYIYTDLGGLPGPSLDLARQLLTQQGLAVSPGVDFDTEHGHQRLRWAYSQPIDVLQEAVRRLGQFMASQHNI